MNVAMLLESVLTWVENGSKAPDDTEHQKSHHMNLTERLCCLTVDLSAHLIHSIMTGSYSYLHGLTFSREVR